MCSYNELEGSPNTKFLLLCIDVLSRHVDVICLFLLDVVQFRVESESS